MDIKLNELFDLIDTIRNRIPDNWDIRYQGENIVIYTRGVTQTEVMKSKDPDVILDKLREY